MDDTRKMHLLGQILDSNLGELMAWRNRSISDANIQTYLEVLISYLKKDAAQLANVARYISLDDNPELYWLANVLVHLTMGTVKLEHIQHLLAAEPKHLIWQPEVQFVAALAFEACGDLSRAKTLFFEAHEGFLSIGARKKAAVAYHRFENIFEECLPIAEEAKTKNRAAANGHDPKLSKIENNLVRFIRERPLTKFEIVELLFGREATFQFSEARVEEILEAIHKKRPELIRYTGTRFVANC